MSRCFPGLFLLDRARLLVEGISMVLATWSKSIYFASVNNDGRAVEKTKRIDGLLCVFMLMLRFCLLLFHLNYSASSCCLNHSVKCSTVGMHLLATGFPKRFVLS